jgi:hypothetical protein
MPLRVKVSGSMGTLTGAEHYAAIRSYIATASRHGLDILDAWSVRQAFPRSGRRLSPP